MTAAIIFGYLSLGLIIAAILRSQLPFLQKILIPSSILAGLILLLLGPGLLHIINIPPGNLDGFVYILLTAVFIVLGLRGFDAGVKGREVAATTALLTKGLAVLGIVGLVFTLLMVLFFNPGFFTGFGSLMMLGYGYDPVIARFFGGYWEQSLLFDAGSSIGFSFGVLGFLFSYILGLVIIVRAKKREGAALFDSIDDPDFLSGFLSRNKNKDSGDKLTTDGQSIETLAFHLALVGFALLVTYGIVRAVVYWLIASFGSGVVIVGEVFMGLHFLIAFVIGVVFRILINRLKISYVVDKAGLSRILATLIDYMVVAAIASIPLVISRVHLWEVLGLAAAGAVIAFLVIPLLARLMDQENRLESQVAVFGFLTGNISSSIALLRVLDPRLENPMAGRLAVAGGLIMLTGAPLLFIINLPLIGEGFIFLVYAIISMLFYGALWYLAWRFLIRRKTPVEPERTQ